MAGGDVDQAAGFAAVERVIASGALGNAKRLPALIRYVVAEELNGEGERLKAYTIATDVFERGPDFDPQTDSIVRVEVGRLRKALSSYYADMGADDPIRIDIPRGTYRPVFSEIATVASHESPWVSYLPAIGPKSWLVGIAGGAILALSAWGIFGASTGHSSLPETVTRDFVGPRVALQRFSPINDTPEARTIALGLSSELVTELAQYSWLSVHQAPTEELFGMPGDVSAAALSPDFIVVGETQVHNKELHVYVRVLSTPDLKVEWSAEYFKRLDALEIFEAQHDIAHKIIETVGEANGVVPQLVKANHGSMSEVEYEDFRCVLGIFEHWESFSPKVHEGQLTCLEETVERTPHFADAWAALAYIYMEAAVQGFGTGTKQDYWADAKHAVDKALEIAPLSDRALSAAMSWSISNPRPDPVAFRKYGARYVTLRPNSPEALAAFGFHLGVNTGDWKQALVLLDKALALSDRPPSWYHLGSAYYAILDSYPEEAWAAASRVIVPGSKVAHILRAIAAARSNRGAKLEEHLKALSTLGVGDANAAVSYVQDRQYEPNLRDAMIKGIQDAYAKAELG